MYKKKSTNKLSMRQQIVILALIIVLPASALMVAWMTSNKQAEQAALTSVHATVLKGTRLGVQQSYEKKMQARSEFSDEELALYEYYQGEEFYSELDKMLEEERYEEIPQFIKCWLNNFLMENKLLKK